MTETKNVFPGRFAGKTAVVTGAAQSIGKTVALRLAAEGATVAMVDRSDLAIRSAGEACDAGGLAFPLLGDMEQADECARIMAEVVERCGRIDVLINNVGGAIWFKPFEHFDAEQIRKEISRSLFPTLWCCHAALPHMLKQGGGAIVNVSSIATRGLNRVPYAAAKGGVNALTACLAFENGERGVRVNAVATGGTDVGAREIPRNPNPRSAQEEEWYDAIVKQTIDSSLMKRYSTMEEQAAVILFLASDEASYITGVTVPVGGGDLG